MIEILCHLIIIVVIVGMFNIPIIGTTYDTDAMSIFFLTIVMTYVALIWFLLNCGDDNKKEPESKNILKDNDRKYETKNITKENTYIEELLFKLEKNIKLLNSLYSDQLNKTIHNKTSSLMEPIKELTTITKGINNYLQEHNESILRANKFIEYYLPMTCKLLKTYNNIEDVAMKKEILATIRKLPEVFKKEKEYIQKLNNLELNAELKILNNEIKNHHRKG